MFGEKLSAQDALQCGFVARLVPHDQFRRVTEVLIDGYTDFLPSSQLISKRMLRDRQQIDRLHECNQRETNAIIERLQSDDVMTRLMQKFAKTEKTAAKL
jgi:enoyl-CoA hydratase/carnithine racemase